MSFDSRYNRNHQPAAELHRIPSVSFIEGNIRYGAGEKVVIINSKDEGVSWKSYNPVGL